MCTCVVADLKYILLFSYLGKPIPMTPSGLLECQVCFDIVHPQCVGVDPLTISFNEDLPNSWECLQCCEKGKNLDGKRQAKVRARKLSVSSAASSAPTTDSERATTPSKRSRSDPSEVSYFILLLTHHVFNPGCLVTLKT